LAQRHGIALLLVTHDIDEAVLLGDRVVVLGTDTRGTVDDIPIDVARPRQRTDRHLAEQRAHVLGALHEAHAL